jgi:hypothetical protein
VSRGWNRRSRKCRLRGRRCARIDVRLRGRCLFRSLRLEATLDVNVVRDVLGVVSIPVTMITLSLTRLRAVSIRPSSYKSAPQLRTHWLPRSPARLLIPFKPSNDSGSGRGSESSLLTPCRSTFSCTLGIL